MKQFYWSVINTEDWKFPHSSKDHTQSRPHPCLWSHTGEAPTDTTLTRSHSLSLWKHPSALQLSRTLHSFSSLKSCIQIIYLSFLFDCPVTSRDVRCLSENNLAHKWRNCVVIYKKYRCVKRTPEVSRKAQEMENIPFCSTQLLFLGSVLFVSFISNLFMLWLCRLRQTHITEIAR